MKRIFLAAATSLIAFGASANCTIDANFTGDFGKIFKAHDGWGFKNYDEVCAKLAKANAKLQITSMSGVLSNHSFGWVVVQLRDASSKLIIPDYGSLNTQMHTYASQDKAQELVWDALNAAVENWDDLDQAIAVLNDVRVQNRAGTNKAPAKK